nr:sorbitol dehydrogenase isoform X3 [Halyomorpha halys]
MQEVRTVTQPKENEVLLRVGSCCISTYDFDYLTRLHRKDASYDKTLVLGTFGTGIVIKAGAKVQEMFNPGKADMCLIWSIWSGSLWSDHVALEPGITCQKCDRCISGRTNLCPSIKYLGTEGLDGVLCRFINHPANFTHKLPSGVSLELGTLASKIAGCIHAYHRAGISRHTKILIMGTSLIGLLAIMIFKHLGVGSIFVAESNNYKLKMAQNVGADYVIKLSGLYSPEYPEYLREIISAIEASPDIVIDTIGTVSSVDNSFNLSKSGGRVVLMSRMTRPIETKLYHTTLREIELVGAYACTHSSFIEGLELLSNNNIPLKKILPIKIPLERALDAFSHGRATGGENLFILVNCYDEQQASTTHQSTVEKTASIPGLMQVSSIMKPAEPLPAKQSSTGSETEKYKEKLQDITTSSIPQAGESEDRDTKKLTSISPTDDKEKGETKKRKIYEIAYSPQKNYQETKQDKAEKPLDQITVSRISEATEPLPIKESSIASEKGEHVEKLKQIIPGSKPQADDSEECDTKKLTSISPMGEKEKRETKKRKIYEIIYRPKSAKEKENQLMPQDNERKAKKKKTKQDLNKKNEQRKAEMQNKMTELQNETVEQQKKETEQQNKMEEQQNKMEEQQNKKAEPQNKAEEPQNKKD